MQTGSFVVCQCLRLLCKFDSAQVRALKEIDCFKDVAVNFGSEDLQSVVSFQAFNEISRISQFSRLFYFECPDSPAF